jgi:hypothetical protein
MYFIGGSSIGVSFDTQHDERAGFESTPVSILHRAGDMDEDRTRERQPNVIEGADAGALGTSPPPETAPPGAEVDASEHLVPGATFDDRPPTGAKPWFTSLAFDDDQAGVGNDPPDAQRVDHPLPDAEERGRQE